MQVFKCNDPKEWISMLAGEGLTFPAVGVRKVRFQVVASARTDVFLQDGDDGDLLLASADGLFEVEYAAEGETAVRFASPHGALLAVRPLSRDPVVAPVEAESFTTVFPMERRSSEMDRMMLWVRLNEKRREAILEADRAEYRRRMQEADDKAKPKELQKPVETKAEKPETTEKPAEKPAEAGG